MRKKTWGKTESARVVHDRARKGKPAPCRVCDQGECGWRQIHIPIVDMGNQFDNSIRKMISISEEMTLESQTSAYQCVSVRTSVYQCVPVRTSAYE